MNFRQNCVIQDFSKVIQITSISVFRNLYYLHWLISFIAPKYYKVQWHIWGASQICHKEQENLLSRVDYAANFPQDISICGSRVLTGLQSFLLVKWNRSWSLWMSFKASKAFSMKYEVFYHKCDFSIWKVCKVICYIH